MKFDNQLWDIVWERNLNAVERHTVAVAVWRRRQPDDQFEAMVACELARRWRRHTVFLMGLYGLWSVFWGLLAVDDVRADGVLDVALSPSLAAIGVLVMMCALAARHHIGGYLRIYPPA